MMGKKDHKNTWYRLMAGLYLTFETVYPAGSDPMMRHLGKVNAGFKKVINHPQLQQYRKPQKLPVVRYLKKTLQMGMYFNESPLYHTIGLMDHHLTWEYGYEQMPDKLADNYAFTEIIGPRGPVLSNQLIVGMVLLGPSCRYPSHRHPNLEESYVCMAGYVNINDLTVLTANSYVMIPENQSHWLSTEAEIPALLVYAWTGDPYDLAHYRMEMD